MRLEALESAKRAGVSPAGPTREEVLSAMRQAQITYLRTSLGHDDTQIDPARVDALRRHAAYLDLLAEQVGEDQATDAWHVVGTIYEWLSRISPSRPSHAAVPSLTRGSGGDLVRSSLAYSSGLHEASSAFAAQRALDAFERLQLGNTIVHTAGLTVLRLLGRRYVEALGGIAAYGSAVQQGIAEETAMTQDWPTLGLLGRIAEAAACQAAAMASGSDELFAEAGDRFDIARQVARTSADDAAALTDRLARVASGMTSRSTFRVLRQAGLPASIVRTFAAARPELWSAQVQAIEGGLLDPDRAFVLSLPTGSGKTFLAQLRVLATLERYPDSWVAYVAPSRALVREAHADLAAALRPHGVRVQKIGAGAEATVLVDEDEVPAVTADRTCAVLTPERLDLYLRTNPEMAGRCRLVVVDEAHHIGDSARGPRLETLLGLLLTRWPNAKPVLLSAFMSNSQDLQAWLGGDAGAFQSANRPTRQLRGVLLRYNERPLPDLWIHGVRHNQRQSTTMEPGWRKWQRQRRVYDVGALLSTTDSPPTAPPTDVRAYALPAITRGTRSTEHTAASRARPARVDRNAGTSIADIAVDVGVALATHPGLVLMFFPGVDWAQSAARQIAERLPVRPDLEPFAAAVATVLGTDDPLVECLRHGCAYHHSQMPEEVVRIVEGAARAQLEVLCATSGLQAGVNLPASIVVAVGDPRKPVGTSPTARDFANMAGRAGRPGYETEGLALFLPSSITYGDPLPRVRGYLAPRDEDTAVVSALGEVLAGLVTEEEGRPLEDLPDVVQQTLLTLWATDLRDDASVTRFLENTLGGRALAARVGPDLAGALNTAAERRGARFSAFAKTALPYVAFQALVDLIPDLIELFDDETWHFSTSRQAATFTQLLLRVPYFADVATRRLGDGYRPEAVEAMVVGWVRGEGYDQLAASLGLERQSAARIVRAVNEITGYLAWGTGSLLSLVAAEQEVTGVHPLLPYLLRFGVDTTVAAYLRLLGVSDRLGALAIARRYPEDAEADFETVDAWTRSDAGRTAIREYYADNLVARSATERDLGLENEPARALPIFFSTRGDHPTWLQAGTFVRLERDPEGGWRGRDLVSHTEWAIDAAPDAGLAVVMAVEAGRMRGVLFVPTEPPWV